MHLPRTISSDSLIERIRYYSVSRMHCKYIKFHGEMNENRSKEKQAIGVVRGREVNGEEKLRLAAQTIRPRVLK